MRRSKKTLEELKNFECFKREMVASKDEMGMVSVKLDDNMVLNCTLSEAVYVYMALDKLLDRPVCEAVNKFNRTHNP